MIMRVISSRETLAPLRFESLKKDDLISYLVYRLGIHLARASGDQDDTGGTGKPGTLCGEHGSLTAYPSGLTAAAAADMKLVAGYQGFPPGAGHDITIGRHSWVQRI